MVIGLISFGLEGVNGLTLGAVVEVSLAGIRLPTNLRPFVQNNVAIQKIIA